MNTKIRNKTQGFTIIEVLIVLAIAGLIMLIVFLAVPALQRNARNTETRAEGARILGAVSEYNSNNNGASPTASSSATTSSDARKIYTDANTKNITTLVIEAETGTTAPSATQAVLRLVAKCNAAGNETDAGAGRQVALLIEIETGSTTVKSCIQN